MRKGYVHGGSATPTHKKGL
ncbi:lactocin 705-alpha family bacteriocin [Rossellomorea aquimaris]|nr:lactocin 705-alpha family bacteriocin [Rossellomorea aquimaris]